LDVKNIVEQFEKGEIGPKEVCCFERRASAEGGRYPARAFRGRGR
jgi:hypothetical protein